MTIDFRKAITAFISSHGQRWLAVTSPWTTLKLSYPTQNVRCPILRRETLKAVVYLPCWAIKYRLSHIGFPFKYAALRNEKSSTRYFLNLITVSYLYEGYEFIFAYYVFSQYESKQGSCKNLGDTSVLPSPTLIADVTRLIRFLSLSINIEFSLGYTGKVKSRPSALKKNAAVYISCSFIASSISSTMTVNTEVFTDFLSCEAISPKDRVSKRYLCFPRRRYSKWKVCVELLSTAVLTWWVRQNYNLMAAKYR